ncbi:hypothetical protein SAMN05192539_105932 [Paraburkholderia diazotrophica]|uniref:Uncharacterized protein n=1 Tax=Paraburkholderia diazotrophica TaxID=667676 RepID=A0A1H7EG97_9BURK|nr:hypothetical protein SAMN05192539_105932 [Paraburkholderia diazotrophica]
MARPITSETTAARGGDRKSRNKQRAATQLNKAIAIAAIATKAPLAISCIWTFSPARVHGKTP